MSIEFTAHADVDLETATDSILADLGPGMAAAFQHRLQATLTGLEGRLTPPRSSIRRTRTTPDCGCGRSPASAPGWCFTCRPRREFLWCG
jgi:hypothetical protein